MSFNEVTAHKWFEYFVSMHNAEVGQVFLIKGNTADLFPYKDEYITLRELWARNTLGRKVGSVWDISGGFSFSDEMTGFESADLRMRDVLTTIANSHSSDDSEGIFAQAIEESGKVGGLPTDPQKVFRILEELLSSGKPDDKVAAIAIDYIESIASEGDYKSPLVVALQRWAGLNSPLLGTGNSVILIEANSGCTSSILSGGDSPVISIHIPRPNRDELVHFIECSFRSDKIKFADNLDVLTLANLSTGLRCRDLDDIFLFASVNEMCVSEDLIWNKKRELIEAQTGGILKVVRPKHGLDSIGGMEYIKVPLRRQIKKLKTGDITTNKAIMLMGPPGTGKTMIAEALARESGVNFVIMQNVLDKYVGESDKRLNLALEIAVAMSPTIMFMDEAAESIGNSDGHSGDSGVSDRIRGKLQNVIGDDSLRGRLFFILATNYPERLSGPMLRRMDKRVAVLPEDSSQDKIFKSICDEYGVNCEGFDFSVFHGQLKGWTGSEIKDIVLNAMEFAEEDSKSEAAVDYITVALSDFIRSRKEEEFQRMTAMAIKFSNSKRLIPEGYRDQIKSMSVVAEDEMKKDKASAGRRKGKIEF
ncbi:ATP-binding protein [Patescibacteria group bacterium]